MSYFCQFFYFIEANLDYFYGSWFRGSYFNMYKYIQQDATKLS
jgi:hypothetical protein